MPNLCLNNLSVTGNTQHIERLKSLTINPKTDDIDYDLIVSAPKSLIQQACNQHDVIFGKKPHKFEINKIFENRLSKLTPEAFISALQDYKESDMSAEDSGPHDKPAIGQYECDWIKQTLTADFVESLRQDKRFNLDASLEDNLERIINECIETDSCHVAELLNSTPISILIQANNINYHALVFEVTGFSSYIDFARKNYGVKWNASECYFDEITDTNFDAWFQSPWGPPHIWFDKVCEKIAAENLDSIDIKLSYGEGNMIFGGSLAYSIKNGLQDTTFTESQVWAFLGEEDDIDDLDYE